MISSIRSACSLFLATILLTFSLCAAQTPPSPTFEELLVQANTLFKEGKAAEAFSATQAAARLDPKRYEAPALAALILHKTGHPAEAKDALADAMKLAPPEKQAGLRTIAGMLAQPGESRSEPAVAAAPAAAASGVVDPATLSGNLRRRYDTLLLIIEEADNAKLADERKKLLAEFLDKSDSFVKEQPGLMHVWLIRAVAALELNRPAVGWQAGQQLVRLGAENSNDAKVRRVFAMLDRQGWLSDSAPKTPEELAQEQAATKAAAKAAAEAAERDAKLARFNSDRDRAATAALRPFDGKSFDVQGLGLSMIAIQPGFFLQGSVEGGGTDEVPGYAVVSWGFWLGKTEVTQAQWQVIMGKNPSNFKGANSPIENVSWDEAMAFCRKLTERERKAGRLPDGYAYTLPTEAQWEFACRAGTTGDYAGNLDAMAWYDSNSGRTTHAVGQKQANAWNLQDMHGNVWEWCLDWYGNYPSSGVRVDYAGATSGSNRVNRGGSWNNTADNCRSANRNRNTPDNRNNNLGFRLALSSHHAARTGRRTEPAGVRIRRARAWRTNAQRTPPGASRRSGGDPR